MTNVTLSVYRDCYDKYQLVGTLSVDGKDGDNVSFVYDKQYLSSPDAHAISVTLPLTPVPYRGRLVRSWFGALIPEGRAAVELSRQYRVDADNFVGMIEKLNDETIGCLVFATPDTIPGKREAYQQLDSTFLELFAASPIRMAQQTLGEARLSLAGEMSKVGLYRDESSGNWFLPVGSAPSTHIVKACTGEYPGQTINEALCMKAAELCELEVPDTYLLDCGASEPILVSRRFDRRLEGSGRLVSGLVRPIRLHQEDFCQALGVPTALKYEMTGANFLENMAHCVSQSCDNAFGERLILLESVVFSYLVGNCDNHLKNYSLLYDRNMMGCTVSPTYDVTSTTYYPELSRDMGVSLTMSRRIDDVRREHLESACKRVGVSLRVGMNVIDNLRQKLPGAIEAARDYYRAKGIAGIDVVADGLLLGVRERVEATRL
ncbi:MAG: HipA domain-containing protein [Coriobacteriales bacterium]|nr:HipA domain-containing protein [Coriobacteriales bacterium]